ncbi:MAG: RsmD family RNA methyltransferase [candidate division Zixibacteria bacterium]|nr:RsmD family RNA methyltransferase [candidate division Zixibacteria bacterium]
MSRKKQKSLDFKVIAGALKGARIVTPDLGVTRPPLTRLRRAIFDFLGPYLDDASYLDLFSGTGSYLFEAVSRGASRAVGVELEPQLAEAINTQAKELGVESSLHCYCQDVFNAIERFASNGTSFDIIMMAPPQYQGLIDQALTILSEHPLSAEQGIIICQHDTSETKDIDFQNYPMLQLRKYGNTTFSVLGIK